MRWGKKNKDSLSLTNSSLLLFRINIHLFVNVLIHFKEKNF
jgi:hypothetical protein